MTTKHERDLSEDVAAVASSLTNTLIPDAWEQIPGSDTTGGRWIFCALSGLVFHRCFRVTEKSQEEKIWAGYSIIDRVQQYTDAIQERILVGEDTPPLDRKDRRDWLQSIITDLKHDLETKAKRKPL
jgi:hypothetical protein